MTTLQTITFNCPICARPVVSQVIETTYQRNGQRTDFQDHVLGPQPYAHLAHTCMACGFTGAREEYENQEHEIRNVDRVMFRQFLWKLTTGLDLTALSGAERWELAAKIAEHEQYNKRVIATRWLYAAWCCVNDDDIEAERFYRIRAAQNLADFLDQPLISEDDVKGTTKATLAYLVGELWRRIGKTNLAKEWFTAAPLLIADPVNEAWVSKACKQQATTPREWFG
jgi:hypothetical protein